MTESRRWLVPIVLSSLMTMGFASRPQADPVNVRLILVRTEAEAADLRDQILAGGSFEALARMHSLDASAAAGGHLGAVSVADLRQEFQDALAGVSPGGVSAVTEVGQAYVLLQRMSPEEGNWIGNNNAGLQALQQGRLTEAVAYLREAVNEAEKLGPNDSRLGESLNNLAATYRLREDYAQAEPLYRRSLAIREQTLGPEHLDVAASLNNLAEMQRYQREFAEAEPLYRRSLAILEQVLGSEHPNVAQVLNNLAQLLQAQENYAEAEPLYRRSLAITEKTLGPEHLDMAASLNNLAQLLERQGRYAEAEPLLRRSLAILERTLGPEHPNVAQSLGRLAEILNREGNHAEAETLLRRSLTIRWGRPSGGASADVPGLLDKFTAVMRLAYFEDATFEDAFAEYDQAIRQAPIGEDLYVAMSALLIEVARKEEAETVMMRAVEAYPQSWRARYELGEVLVEATKLQQALEQMEAAVEMGSSPSPNPRQQSFVYLRMGDIQAELLLFDQAESSYRTAMELDPERLESHLALGDLYLGNNRLEEALAEYTRVLSDDPENAAAQTGLAEVNLRMGQFAESVAAAERALEIDPNGQPARYHRARALIQMGRREEGQTELQAYQKVQAEAQAAEDSARNVYVLNSDAAEKLLAGEDEEALGLFREGIESHPQEAAFYFNLAVALGRLGRHDAAVEVLESMIDMEIGDDFLARRSLATEYELLGDSAASARHRAAYLQKIEAELRARVD